MARILAAVVIIVIIVVAGVGLYYATMIGKTSTFVQTPSNNLVVDEGEQPDSMDPAVEFHTSGSFGVAFSL